MRSSDSAVSATRCTHCRCRERKPGGTGWNAPLLALVVGLSLGWTPLLSAQGLPFSGELQEDEAPVSGNVDMLFEVFDAPAAGTLLWSDTLAGIEVSRGRFHVTLGDDGSLDELLDGEPRWIALTIDGDLLAPRLPMQRVPYAVRAEHANALAPNAILAVEEALAQGELLREILDRIASLEEAPPSGLPGSSTGSQEPDTATLLQRIEQLETRVLALEDALAATEDDNTALRARLDVLDSAHDDTATRLQQLSETLDFLDREGQDILFTGVNLHLRSGTQPGTFDNTTLAYTPPASDGTGNLILGHNEAPPLNPEESLLRQGSHNLIIGPGHQWHSHGAIVAGTRSTVGSADSPLQGASVLGGVRNRTLADHAVSVGGNGNRSEGLQSVSVGGTGNRSVGDGATVVGGVDRVATGANAVVPSGGP